MRNHNKPLSRDQYKRLVVDKIAGFETYWTEIQMLADDKFDLVSCHKGMSFTGPRRVEVVRWWHSAQHGYYTNLHEAIKAAKGWERSYHVVDMQNKEKPVTVTALKIPVTETDQLIANIRSFLKS